MADNDRDLVAEARGLRQTQFFHRHDGPTCLRCSEETHIAAKAPNLASRLANAFEAALDREERLREQIAAVESVVASWRMATVLADSARSEGARRVALEVSAALAGPGQKGDSNAQAG